MDWLRQHGWPAAIGVSAVAAVLLYAVVCLPPPRPLSAHAGPPAAPPSHLTGFYTPEAGSTVGTGMIVSVVFDHPVAAADRAAVGRGVTVVSRPAVPVAGHWFGPRRLDLRPEHYWAPGTVVDLRLRLRGVRGAPRTYGTQRKDVVFRVGRRQTSTVDAVRRTMTVRRSGRVLRRLPVSAGGPGHTTYRGLMVVSEKFRVTRMDGATVGYGGEYDIADVPHAMRLTDSGTFVHGNYWSPPEVFGELNTSHGCVGLADARGGDPLSPAGWFYDHTLVGDVVEVTGSGGAPVAPDNGLDGWNMPWSAWRAAPAAAGAAG